MSPDQYYQPYDAQIRRHARQYAAGQTDPTRRAPFRTPRYYGKEDTGQRLGTSYESQIPDPGNAFVSATFAAVFGNPREAAQVASHVNLEGPSAQITKQQLGLPYQDHSIIDLGKVTGFIKGGLARVFSGNQFDTWARKGFDALDRYPATHRVLQAVEDVRRDETRSLHEWAQGHPTLDRLLRQRVDSQHDFDDLKDFGKAYGQLGASVAKIFGYEGEGRATPRVHRFEHNALTNLVAPAVFLGLNVAPVALEMIHHARMLAGDKEARRRAEEHHNLESPTGRIVKATLGLPYRTHSTVDNIASAFAHHLLPKLEQLGLRKGEYVIGGSGALFEHGIRPGDADLRMNQQGFRRLLERGHAPTDHGSWQSIELGGVQVWGPGGHGSHEVGQHIANAVEMHGLQFQARHVALEMKEKFARPKDLDHLRLAGYNPDPSLRARIQSYDYDYQNGLAVPRHQNLEDANAPHLRTLVGSHYRQHSEPDAPGAANDFKGMDALKTVWHYDPYKQVRAYFDRLEDKYPHLVGNPRKVIKNLYLLETSAYEFAAQHDNVILSSIARALLFGERVEHDLDYTYKFSPTRFTSRLLRAVAGIEKRNYEHLALHGLEGKTNVLRFVKIAGTAIGVAETVLRYRHAIKEIGEYKNRLFGTGDPETGRARRLDRERRRQLRRAIKLGQKYDPTRPGRQDQGGAPWYKVAGEELVSQFSPRAHLRYLGKVMHDPKSYLPSLGVYATVAGLTAFQGYRAWQSSSQFEGVGRVGSMLQKLFEGEAVSEGSHVVRKWTGMAGRALMGTVAYGAVGILTGRSWSARAGFFSNLLATLLADTAGNKAATWAAGTDWGRLYAAKTYKAISKMPAFFEVHDGWLAEKGAEFARKAEVLAKSRAAGFVMDRETQAIIREVSGNVSRVGIEAAGLLLEGSILIPIRHLLRRTGRALDRHDRVRRAYRRADREGREEDRPKQQSRDGGLWLRRYMLTFSAPALSQKDALLNPDYDPRQRVLLLAARRSESLSSLLDAVGKAVNPVRRVRAGFHAWHTARKGRSAREDWRNRLARTYAAPAYSDADIASNPQYSAAERLLLHGVSRSRAGHAVLERLSPAVTRARRARAGGEAVTGGELLHLGHHLAHHTLKHHGHGKPEDALESVPLPAAASDLLQGVHSVAKTAKHAADSLPRRKGKSKLKVRSHARHTDVDPDERMLHAAYSRYLNYGHPGNSLTPSDNPLN